MTPTKKSTFEKKVDKLKMLKKMLKFEKMLQSVENVAVQEMLLKKSNFAQNVVILHGILQE